MDYEINYDNQIISLRFIILALVFIGVLTFLFSPIIAKSMEKPVIEEVKKPVNESTAIQIVTQYVYVTPTPDGKLYYASEQEEGIRKIQNPFSFYANNASGHKKMKVVSEVYEYKIYDMLTWHNPSDNKDYPMYPTTGNKFLFVFYAMYLDDRVGDDTRFYIPNSSNYVVYSLNEPDKIYFPLNYPKQIRYLELEETWDYLHREQSQYFATQRLYSSSQTYRETAGEYVDEQVWLKGGKSNVMSGYILYEIPEYYQPDELIAGINFYSWGNALWRLKP